MARPKNVLNEVEDLDRMLEENQARRAKLVKQVIAGEATLGDPLSDFVTRRLEDYNAQIINRYFYLQEQLAAHQGELVLICRCWTEEVTTLHGGPIDGNQSYTHVHTDLVIGIIKGKRLRIVEDSLRLGLARYVARMPAPRFNDAGSVKWELFQGSLNLNLASHGVRAQSWLTRNEWDWSLPLDEKINTAGFRGNSMFPQMSTFPEQPLKLSIAIGDEAVDAWLEEHNALMRTTGLQLETAFGLLKRPFPPNMAEVLERRAERQGY
ncbi:hypothetical protein EPO04_02325 [Patescibacteria group bacterium]|nr:MAG: hypothetical protein EPO04_02325 [Patescibacteria group bacterium]